MKIFDKEDKSYLKECFEKGKQEGLNKKAKHRQILRRLFHKENKRM